VVLGFISAKDTQNIPILQILVGQLPQRKSANCHNGNVKIKTNI
jgi:hypothetical protein